MLWQYQSIAEPILVEAAAVDTWFQPASEPVRITPTPTVGEPVFVGDISVEDVTLDKWWQPASEPVRTRPPSPEGMSVAVVQEIVRLDKWFQPASEPVRVPRPLVPEGISSWMTEPTLLVVPSLDRVAWFAQSPGPTFGAEYFLYQGRFEPVLAEAEEDVTLDKWWRQTGEPVRPIPPHPVGGSVMEAADATFASVADGACAVAAEISCLGAIQAQFGVVGAEKFQAGVVGAVAAEASCRSN